MKLSSSSSSSSSRVLPGVDASRECQAVMAGSQLEGGCLLRVLIEGKEQVQGGDQSVIYPQSFPRAAARAKLTWIEDIG